MAGYNGFTILTHSGLTTYIEQDEFPELNAAYKKNGLVESNACAEVIHYRKAATQAKQTKKQAKEPTPAVKIFYPNNFLSVLDN